MQQTDTEQVTNAELTSIPKSWLDQLDEAVSNVDEQAIWRLMDQQSSSEAAHEALTSMVSRLAYVHQDKNTYCELFMMPVVTMQGCNVIDNQAVWKGVRNQVREALGSWFNDDGRTTLFDDIAPMDWITTWSPGVLRAHLERLIPGSGRIKATFPTSQIALPDEAPRLGFVVIGRTTHKGWRELPTANGLMDKRLKDVVKFCLQIQAPTPSSYMAPAPIVLTPERVQFAIADGVALWLNKLHESVGIEGWTVMPSLTARDVVKVTLKLRSQQVELTQFTLRLHQIGTQGLSDVLGILKHMAPMFDTPSDMGESEYKNLSSQGLDS